LQNQGKVKGSAFDQVFIQFVPVLQYTSNQHLLPLKWCYP